MAEELLSNLKKINQEQKTQFFLQLLVVVVIIVGGIINYHNYKKLNERINKLELRIEKLESNQ